MPVPTISQSFFPLEGGLDLITPAISMDPGKCIDAQNYEPINGQYLRITGFEASDGQASPTAASYWMLGINQTGVIAVGDTLTGASSGATCRVLAIFGTNVIAGRLIGIFTLAENLTDAGTVGTVTSAAIINSAPAPSDDADYMLLAANDQRLNITKVPGSGKIRGVWVYRDVVYAFRDNAAGTAGGMYKQTAGGWVPITFGFEIGLTTLVKSAVVTVTSATPGVVSWASHGMANGQPVVMSSTGTTPTGITAGTINYVVAAAAGTFELAATVGGAPIATTSTGTGTITCTALGGNIYAGSTVTGVTSGATATVGAALLRTGSWTTSLVGNLVVASTVGTFISGEILTVGGLMVANTSSLKTAITRLPGGQMEFFNDNFTGSTNTLKMYGVDGVNPAFEFDGATYVPIHTGMATDTPQHVRGHLYYLFLSFYGSVQFSALGQPYTWTTVLGAGEISTGDAVSCFLPNAGNVISGSTLQICTNNRLFTLYGSSTLDFKMVASISDIGYSPFTGQLISNNAYGMTARGIQSIITTLNFGDFDYASISHEIQPLINLKKGLEIASTTIKGANQYRVFFSDGTALVVGLTGDKVSAILPLNYGMPVRCICTATLSTGAEVTYFGSDDGYVYRDNIGTSQNGAQIEAWLRLPFNHCKSPQLLKTFRRAIIEGVVKGYAQINTSYDLGYGNPDVQPSAPTPDMMLAGSGGYWDQFTWDQFTWDSAIIAAPVIDLGGTETNISLLFYSNRAQDQPHSIQGVNLIFSPRRLKR